MARARNIKPGFFTNDQIGELAPLARLLFIGMWCLADRAGRLEDRPKKIRAEVLPYDTDCDADLLLSDIAKRGFIVRYAVNGTSYIQILNFEKHQSPHVKEQASTIPAPDISGASTEVAGLIVDCGLLIADSGLLIPDSGLPSTPTPKNVTTGLSPRVPKKPASDKSEAKTGLAWEAYRAAYADRYAVEPVRNARTNSQMAQFVDRVGVNDAPQVAAHFLRNNSAYYVTKGHAVGILLNDAEKLRTEWATGNVVTTTQARQWDRTAATGAVFMKLIDEARNVSQG